MQFTVNSKLPITGFELWISSVRSDSCTKCATTAGFCFKLDFLKADSRFFYSGRMLWSRSLQGLSGSIRDFATGGLHQQESCWRWVAESLLSRYLLHARLARWADGWRLRTMLTLDYYLSLQSVWPYGLFICTILGNLQQWNLNNTINILPKLAKYNFKH